MKPRGYWKNYQTVYDAAKKCKTLQEFKKTFYQAYNVSVKENWLKDFNWLKRLNKWSYNSCIEESKKYKSKVEFQKNNGSAYAYSRKHGYLKEMIWLEPKCKENGYWDIKENCIEESKKYKSRTEFQKKCVGAYIKSRINGWLNEMIWLKTVKNEVDHNIKNILIYVYEIKETNSAYIGLTNNIIRRHNSHNKKNKNKYDSVKEHCVKNSISLPQPIILEINLNYQEGQIREDYWKNWYQNNGWNILNKAKTGVNSSSIGGNLLTWTKDKVIEESKKYQTLKDFTNNSNGAYSVAAKYNWLDEMVWLKRERKPFGYWDNYENYLELRKTCNTKKDLRKKSDSAYRSMLKYKWDF